MTAEAGKDWLLDSEDDDILNESDEDFDARLARAETGDAETEGTETEDAEDETNVDLVLGFAEEYAAEQASVESERAQFRAQIEENLPDYQRPPEPLSRIEEAAVAASKLQPGSAEFEAFKARLAAANEDLARKARAGDEGFDMEGDPVVERFDPSGLDSEAFNIFMAAVSSGGANPRRVPANETYDSWSKKVNSALGRG